MAYFELWLSINFLLDETDVYRWHWNYRKKFQLKSTPFTLLGDKIAKNNQEDPGESSVNINRKLITESIQKITFVTGFQPIRSSPAVFYSFLFQLRHSDSNFSSILNGNGCTAPIINSRITQSLTWNWILKLEALKFSIRLVVLERLFTSF